MGKQSKVVRIPVHLADEDEIVRRFKYRALDLAMSEARYIGNMAFATPLPSDSRTFLTRLTKTRGRRFIPTQEFIAS